MVVALNTRVIHCLTLSPHIIVKLVLLCREGLKVRPNKSRDNVGWDGVGVGGSLR